MSKQAVLLIHGIGEQIPMESLRSFVHTAWTTDESRQRERGDRPDGVWSKPYTLDEDFELRRLTTATNRAGLRTDFFEFYWAHLMQGTQISHVVAWAKGLLIRPPSTVPHQLRLAWWTLVLLVAFGLVMAYRAYAASAAGEPWLPFWQNLALSLVVLPALYGILRNMVGDAARYLHVKPSNVHRRHEIRAAGLRVLKALHERGYDRIIVVGHSLGSVIGYDILSHAWLGFHDKAPGGQLSFDALAALEAMAVAAEDGNPPPVAEFQAAQRRYFNELVSNQNPWRVSDFITLGSPLAHAEILLARNAGALAPRFEDREFPCSPPVLERSRHEGREIRRFSYPPGAEQRTPHHAAVFAPVRWTNLYFPNRLLVVGDLIGGPLRRVFGTGVRDVEVRTGLRAGLLSHTLYWRPEGADSPHVTALRDALDLMDTRNEGVAP